MKKVLITLLLIALSASLHAGYTWQGGTETNWYSPNWDNNGTPNQLPPDVDGDPNNAYDCGLNDMVINIADAVSADREILLSLGGTLNLSNDANLVAVRINLNYGSLEAVDATLTLNSPSGSKCLSVDTDDPATPSNASFVNSTVFLKGDGGVGVWDSGTLTIDSSIFTSDPGASWYTITSGGALVIQNNSVVTTDSTIDVNGNTLTIDNSTLSLGGFMDVDGGGSVTVSAGSDVSLSYLRLDAGTPSSLTFEGGEMTLTAQNSLRSDNAFSGRFNWTGDVGEGTVIHTDARSDETRALAYKLCQGYFSIDGVMIELDADNPAMDPPILFDANDLDPNDTNLDEINAILADPENGFIVNRKYFVLTDDGVSTQSLTLAEYLGPYVVNQPANVGSFPYTDARYEGDPNFVSVFDSPTTPTSITWTKDGTYFADGTWSSNGTVYTAVLEIPDAELADEGVYACTFVSPEGTVNSNDAGLRIKRQKAHWRFEGNFDESLGNYPALDTEGTVPTFDTGIEEVYEAGAGQAAVFDGATTTGSYAVHRFADTAGELWWTGYTLSFWVKTPDPAQSQYTGIFASFMPNTDGFQIDFNASGNYRYWTGSGGTFGPASSDPNEWTHLAVVSDFNNETRLYYNGALTNTLNGTESSFNAFLFASSRNRDSADDAYFNGSVDDAKLWNYPLTEQEIAEIYWNSTHVSQCIETFADTFNLDNTGSSYCKIDLADFAILAQNWLACGLYDQNDCP